MTFGIIGAMESEVEYLKDAMVDAHAVRVSGMEFYEGTLAGK
jgi:nucleoside phosphorylase